MRTLLALLFTCAFAARAMPAGNDIDPSAAQKLDLFLTRLVPFGYSGAVLVAKGDRILLNRGYGMADNSRGIANSPDTIFPLDSVSKQFTAAAILKLEMMGKLSTQDPLSKFFPHLPDDKKDITLHQLLTHTSGILTGTEEYFERNTREEIQAIAWERPLEFPPGTDFSYSNIGYVLLAAVVEQASGTSYERFVHDHLFRPAGMRFTGREIPKWPKDLLAHRYNSGNDGGTLLQKPYPDWNFVGAGSFLSTTGDMFRWDRALHGTAILSDAAKAKMYRPGNGDYAYGWVVKGGDHGKLIEHNGGSSDGSACDFLRFVDQDVTIMIFANNNGESMLFGSGVSAHVQTLAFGGDLSLPPEVAASSGHGIPAALTGTYELQNGGRLVLEAGNDGAVLRVFEQPAIDAILPADSKELDLRKRANEAATRALAGVVKGTPDILKSLLVRPERGDSFYKDLREGLAQDGSSTFEILGTVPDHRECCDHVTFFELQTESGKRLARFHWAGDKIRGLGGSGILEPLKLSVLPSGSDLYSAYSLAESRSVTFRFVKDAMILNGGLTAHRRP